MSSIDTARALIKKHEGLRLYPYKCTAKKTTIGYGRNLEDVGISEAEAFIMLENDIDIVVSSLEQHISFWDKLTSNRQAVFIDMCFNLGLRGFLGFKKMLKASEVGRIDEVIKQMLNSRWAVQVGSRSVELAELYSKG